MSVTVDLVAVIGVAAGLLAIAGALWRGATHLARMHSRMDRWDAAAADHPGLMTAMATQTAALGDLSKHMAKLAESVQRNTAALSVIREQVTIDSGDSLKDRVTQLHERDEDLQQQLQRITAHLSAQDDRARDMHDLQMDQQHQHPPGRSDQTG